MTRALLIALALLLSGCGERASTWDDRSGRYRSTEEMRQERRQEMRDIDRRIDNLEREKK